MNYGNCARCGKIVAYNHVRICDNCKEKELENVIKYLNENGKTKTDELCKVLGIPKRLVVEFILNKDLEETYFNPEDIEEILEEERRKNLAEKLSKMTNNQSEIETKKQELKSSGSKMRFLNRRR